MTRIFISLITGAIALSSQCPDQTRTPSQHKNMEKDSTHHQFTNDLIHETSPYLLQHAHNPVNWYPWGEKALNKAREEKKLLLISIGYSACHWCHVMEKESFEDEEVAAYMNEYFICIKVDREERPDIDQIYMNAVQLVTGRGGWPLNSFALPDGRPFYGGTYFPKKNWIYLLENIVKEYKDDPAKVEEYADQLTKGIQQNELISLNEKESEYMSILTQMTDKWKTQFDNIEGGPDRAPKFPLPNNYEFLLDYAILNNDREILDHVELTLDKMAFGGIYDQIGGGFARYSTDKFWKVPHFEKMLYDNAQLVSLYSKAYRHFKKINYLNVMTQSLEFIKRELTGPKGEFYSALDADSEGEEGKYYVWTLEDLENIKGLNLDIIKATYSIDKKYAWEGKYILHRKKSYEEVSKELGLDLVDYNQELMLSQLILLSKREVRTHPGLDDKSLTSWNALMISGYAEAYKARSENEYINAAETNAKLIWEKQHLGNGKLLHSYKKGKSTINGFLEDYALTAKAYIDLYEIGFDEVWLERSETITQYAIDHFFNKKSNMFYFTSDEQNDLVARKMEVNDNVIPASNSVMADVLYKLGLITDNNEWVEISMQMLNNISPDAGEYGSGYSNWAKLMLTQTHPFYEIAINGGDYRTMAEEMYDRYLPNAMLLASKKESDIPLLKNKFAKGKTVIYVCVNKTCQLPVEDSKKALEQISYR